MYIKEYKFVAPSLNFLNDAEPHFSKNKNGEWIAALDQETEANLADFLTQNIKYQTLDRSVQLALFVANQFQNLPQSCGINIGSSRGATGLWEEFYAKFQATSGREILPAVASPLTTLGNVSSWVAQHLGTTAAAFSHSITCATSAHSILNGMAWIKAGMADSFLVGGSEAPLTDFTIAQMKALRIYSRDQSTFPCRALDVEKTENTMILGEGAGLFHLTVEPVSAKAKIIGFGTSVETLSSPTSVSEDGFCLQQSMRQALRDFPKNEIDAIVTHAPGTIKGDRSELRAIEQVFRESTPVLLNNKWQIGHSLGASAALSLTMALQIFENQFYPNVPYLDLKNSITNAPKRILMNSTGFGGNAVSLLVEKV
ncbi:3-oxoacyl-ACP synthase [Nonlabens spongiae]|uniref:3-oxoacyl-ACP synthase n=1 Tax=Nonlabens spongiae TaxID=331648 RepID=A0A1W6MP90_9FLAO|nr:3-oxoacyl-ACP synthase [Nonlabens spongiae]